MLAAPERRSGARRWKLVAVGMGSLTLVTALACASLLWSPIHRPARVLGARAAVQGRLELGLVLAGLSSSRSLLVVGDSRAEMLDDAALRPTDALQINVGISGSSTSRWKEVLAGRLSERRYDAAVLFLGVNDFLHHDEPASAVSARVVELALGLRAYARRVLVLEQMPVRLPSEPQSRDFAARSIEVNRRVREALAEQGDITILAIYDPLRAPDGLLAAWCSEDGLHLSTAGNAWLGQRIAGALR